MVLRSKVKALFSADKALAKTLKNIFGFYPGNIFLYQLAFRHKSAANETINGYKISNERLEFLGDAILSAAVADFLFKKFPYKNEGFLTEMRARIVSRNSLNKLSQKLGLDDLVLTAKDTKSQFRSASGDAFEAFIGALYLDKGYNFTHKVLIDRIVATHIDLDALEKSESNPKSRLIEWAQKEKIPIEFRVISELGEGYKKQYLVEIHLDGVPHAKGQDFSIKGAEQMAAEKTLQVIRTDQS
ncbi:MAG: ribonuclease III [Bacteroidales bacterium]|nr:ribonuclease III [Bacteroidales bacterium]